MHKPWSASFVLAVLCVGAALTASPAPAKCGKDCLKALASELRACRASCAKGAAGKACRVDCSAESKSDKAACKAATNPRPPDCGETTTTTTTTSTTSTTMPAECAKDGDNVYFSPYPPSCCNPAYNCIPTGPHTCYCFYCLPPGSRCLPNVSSCCTGACPITDVCP